LKSVPPTLIFVRVTESVNLFVKTNTPFPFVPLAVSLILIGFANCEIWFVFVDIPSVGSKKTDRMLATVRATTVIIAMINKYSIVPCPELFCAFENIFINYYYCFLI